MRHAALDESRLIIVTLVVGVECGQKTPAPAGGKANFELSVLGMLEVLVLFGLESRRLVAGQVHEVVILVLVLESSVLNAGEFFLMVGDVVEGLQEISETRTRNGDRVAWGESQFVARLRIDEFFLTLFEVDDEGMIIFQTLDVYGATSSC